MTAVVVGATLGAGIWLIERQRERIGDREAGRARRVAASAFERRSLSVEQATDVLVERIQGDRDVLLQLIGREPVSPDLATDLARGSGFDVVDLRASSGEVLASLHWPERVGLSGGRTNPLSGAARIDTPGGPRVGWFASQELRIGQRRLLLTAGRFLDEDWLGEAAALADGYWWLPEGSPDEVGHGPEDESLPRRADLRRAVKQGRARFESWRLIAVAMEGETGPLGHLVLGVREIDDRSAWVRLRGAWAGLTLAAALAAALVGMVLGRRLARPVDELVRAVDAIAAGEEDYTFAGMHADEFDALTASFSRLQRSLEQQQRRSAAAERVAAWQEVARHVAHEVKNPLVPIRLTVQNLQRARTARPEGFGELFEEGAQTILEEVDQLTRLVGEFSEFARLPVPEPRPESLEPVLDEVLELFAADPNLRLERESDGTAPVLEFDRDQILRVFKNIVGNAVEAMAGRAPMELAVSTRVVEGYAEISFADRGPGFDAESADRVFEPYFTTKTGGTGLGMAISYRIVAEHGGEIVADNRRDGGARVTVRLPLPGKGER